MDTTITVLVGGCFTIIGVVIGWLLNEFSTARRAKPSLCFKLGTTPTDEMIEPELRTKESNSDYCLEIYNMGQTPFLLDSFYFVGKGSLLIDCPVTDEDLTILPHHKKTHILMQQDAEALEWHCKDKDLKECKVIATSVNGKRVKSMLDVTWIHMRVRSQSDCCIVK